MGKGKGAPEGWVAVIKPGKILYEIHGVDPELAKRALVLASNKFSFATKVIAKEDTI